ncbi:hypothetical protein RIF29_08500 [Crotalaria pallida]|uniref:Uncharacterized protein n=1 Tax=Crotalaria pallida TaxID=3830 RepID=A0AAN9FQV9_CROPI
MENIEPQAPPPTTLPITTVTVVDGATTTLPFTITANSITTAGQWSPHDGNPLFFGLTLPTPLTLPTTITVATNTFTILTSIEIHGNSTFDITPTSTIMHQNQLHHLHLAQHHRNNNTFTAPITGFPIELYLCLTHNTNTNINAGASVLIRINNPGVSYSTLVRPFSSAHAAFISMRR